jgi:hypothetical protein
VFDAAAAACPVCGAAAAAPAPDPAPVRVDPAPRPRNALFALAVGAALLLLLTVFVVFRGAPPDVERTPPPVIEAARAPGDAIDVPAEKSAPPPADNVETVAAPDAKVERWRTVMVIAWSSRSDAGRTDAGTIEALDADRFIAHTKGGPILWERVK